MSMELLYTSASQGLKQGSRGFCTVLSTVGTPINLANRLESLSAYRHVFAPNSSDAPKNPVCYSHLKVAVGGQRLSVLSRIADYGVDYSQRTNKIAHHVVLDSHEFSPAGPAWLMLEGGIMRSQWNGNCQTPEAGPAIPMQERSAAICHNWERLTGDAGWAGVVASAFSQASSKPLWIVFSIEQSAEMLSLIAEATALLPPSQRWAATFATYVTKLPPDVDCRVRCVVAGSDEARLAPARGTMLDLSTKLPSAPGSGFDEVARYGGPVTSAPTPVAPMRDSQIAAGTETAHTVSPAPVPPALTPKRVPPSPPTLQPPDVPAQMLPSAACADNLPPESAHAVNVKLILVSASVVVCVLIAVAFWFLFAPEEAIVAATGTVEPNASSVTNSSAGEEALGEQATERDQNSERIVDDGSMVDVEASQEAVADSSVSQTEDKDGTFEAVTPQVAPEENRSVDQMHNAGVDAENEAREGTSAATSLPEPKMGQAESHHEVESSLEVVSSLAEESAIVNELTAQIDLGELERSGRYAVVVRLAIPDGYTKYRVSGGLRNERPSIGDFRKINDDPYSPANSTIKEIRFLAESHELEVLLGQPGESNEIKGFKTAYDELKKNCNAWNTSKAFHNFSILEQGLMFQHIAPEKDDLADPIAYCRAARLSLASNLEIVNRMPDAIKRKGEQYGIRWALHPDYVSSFKTRTRLLENVSSALESVESKLDTLSKEPRRFQFQDEIVLAGQNVEEKTYQLRTVSSLRDRWPAQ